MSWDAARRVMGSERVLLGPQASYQWLHDPKHLLFVLARYKHAARLIGGGPKLVLEVGCGEGIGARLLGEEKLYIGIDPDERAVAVAAEHLWRAGDELPEYDLAVTDLERLDGDVRVGAVVALDVIEHVADPVGWLAAAVSHLTADGVCVIGTPNATASAHQSAASRAGHVRLFSADELHGLLAERFRVVQLFGMNDEVLHTGYLPMAHYLLAVGIGPR
jgi:2-polyprenyl-3-methyl-5-hydroxy-6-metoxy-1,4-benzoquinol methylase